MEENLKYLACGLGFLVAKAKKRNRITWCDFLVVRCIPSVYQNKQAFFSCSPLFIRTICPGNLNKNLRDP
jgi:hypothetical protein